MKFNKLVLTSAVCAALGGLTTTVQAAITAVPGEAALVPLVMTDGAIESYYHETYITLMVPDQIGADTVINYFTAPNTTKVGTTAQLTDGKVGEIHWFLMDYKSEPIQDGTCEVSAGDVVVWTTDRYLQDVQGDQDEDFIDAGEGLISSICGPSARPNLAYVVFQTEEGATGKKASFAFAGNAAIDAYYLSYDQFPVISVPFVPMADGADPTAQCGTKSTTGQPQWKNEVITGSGSCTDSGEPFRYAPVVAGIRMNNGDATVQEVRTQMEIPGPNDNGYFVGSSNPALHVHWFDRNESNRQSLGNIYDDQEGRCSDTLPLPWQLNAHLYNVSLEWGQGFNNPEKGGRWDTFYADMGEYTDGARIDLIAALVTYDGQKGYRNGKYATCAPYWQDEDDDGVKDEWEGTLMGYREGRFAEIMNPVPTGLPNSASVQFSAIGSSNGNYGWRSHLATELGIF
jgi:hypothetical protein